MGALCSAGEGPTEILPRSLPLCEGGKNEMRHKPCWLLLLTGTAAYIYTDELAEREKKIIIGSRSGPSHRPASAAGPDTKARSIRMRISTA